MNILIAYILDLIFGDPQWHWHPVRLIGRLIERLEKILNIDRFNKIFAGFVLVVLVIGITISFVRVSLELAKLLHPILYYIISVLFIYFALSTKALGVEANKVGKALKNKDIQKARNYLSMIVGRDTDNLSEPEVIRASAETVAESIMDGIVAPLFYAFLGGPVLVWTYKAINTLDSMVGYRSERFIEFGRISAKLDGLANFIPARLTCFLIGASSLCSKKDYLRSFKWGCRYFFRSAEKNSEATEAAMAGALRVKLGGLNFYNSIADLRPFIGDDIESPKIEHINESIRIAYLSSGLVIGLGIFSVMLTGRG